MEYLQEANVCFQETVTDVLSCTFAVNATSEYQKTRKSIVLTGQLT